MRKNTDSQPGRYVRIPHDLLASAIYRGLSFSAKALLIDIAEQFDGTNSRALICTWTHMKKRGWASQVTVHKAKAELIAAGILVEIRGGSFLRGGTSLYTLSWLSSHEEKRGLGDCLASNTRPAIEVQP